MTEVKKLPKYLYHGTSKEVLKSILEKGLDPYFTSIYRKSEYIKWDWTCLTSQYKLAAQRRGTEPIVIRIPVDRLNKKKFCLEKGMLIHGGMDGCKTWDYNKDKRWSWYNLFKTVGCVGYRGIIKVYEKDIIYVH